MRSATDDTLVYTFEDDEYKIFRITNVDRNLVSVTAIEIEAWEPLYRIPSFANVGCFKVKGESAEVQLLAKCEIKGKVILVGNDFAVTVPKILLDEAV